MGIISYIGAIASSVIRNKNQKAHRQPDKMTYPIPSYTKEQSYKWLEEGKCQCCGADSGEYKGICDECRWK